MFQYNGGGLVFGATPDATLSADTFINTGVVSHYPISYSDGGLTPLAQGQGDGRIMKGITSGTLAAASLCYMTTTVGGVS